ncbi:Ppx/GppA family phosphatase [Roseomonas marmotae]|uniref:Ppx/GppA family phosphatase n=1 Tax=Roseomonas marmotae TaxID=2768161 RepID=UPI001F31BFB7|nr:Ppx/GppA family phosphatase [Roseomonas marmotae]
MPETANLSPPSLSGHPPRCGVVDLGSNSVRLVVFEGRGRNPLPIFNEKAVLGLGRGLQTTGRLNETAMAQALTVMARYHAVAHAMGVGPLEVLATAAVRDAENGAAFAASLQQCLPGVPIRILEGEQEARLSAEGVLMGFPGADGILGDLGGGSLELVELNQGEVGRMASLPLGAIRLSDRAGGDVAKARGIAEAELSRFPWLSAGKDRDLYLVGGAWRALAKIHIAQTSYPLSIVHHYVLRRDEARDLCGLVIAATRRTLERIPGAPGKRIQDLPFAAVALRRLLRATGARRVVFSANGMREGWYARLLPPETLRLDPLLSAGQEMAARYGRDTAMPQALVDWTAPLWNQESPEDTALRQAACWLSDVGSHDHPDYRAEQSFLRVLRQPGIGLDHHARAFLALATALRYEPENDAPFLTTARMLLDTGAMRRAEMLGAVMRLAYTLSGGTPALLARTSLRVSGGTLTLRLAGSGVFAGDSVQRRVEALAAAYGLEGIVEVG